MNVKYTSNSNNKWGLVSGGESIQYETKKTHNGVVLLVFLVPAAGLAAFIMSLVN